MARGKIESQGGGLIIDGIVNSYLIEAENIISAGDFIKFINTLGPNLNFLNGNVLNISAVALSASKVLIAYSYSTSSFGQARVFTISDTTIISGSPVTFNSGSTSSISAVALSASKVLIAYTDGGNSSYGTAIILTISDTTAEIAGPEFIFNSSTTSSISAVALSASKVLIAYTDGGNSNYGTAIILTISDTTAEMIGAELVFNSSITSYISAVVLSASKVLIAYTDSGNSSYGTTTILTISDITAEIAGTKFVFNSEITGPISAVALSASKVLIAYGKRGGSAGQRSLATQILSISETMIIPGAELKINLSTFNSISTGSKISLVVLSENTILVAYTDTNNLNYGKAVMLNIFDTTIKYMHDFIFNAGDTTYISVVALSTSKVLIAYVHTDSVLFGRTQVVKDLNKIKKTSTLPLAGVAKTGGAGGDIIDIYTL